MSGEEGRIERLAEALEGAGAGVAAAAAQVEALARENRSSLREFTATGLAEFRGLAVQMQETARSVDRVARRLEAEGAGFFVGGETAPEYVPRTTP